MAITDHKMSESLLEALETIRENPEALTQEQLQVLRASVGRRAFAVEVGGPVYEVVNIGRGNVEPRLGLLKVPGMGAG